MTENLDHLLACHHLFHKAFFCCQGTLLEHHIFGAHTAEFLRHGQHTSHKQADYNEHWNAEAGHHDDHDQNGQDRLNQHRHALADHHTDGIRIVGIGTHDVAVGVGVKILDRKGLHPGKHIHTEIF